jgi:hypothetical protein
MAGLNETAARDQATWSVDRLEVSRVAVLHQFRDELTQVD